MDGKKTLSWAYRMLKKLGLYGTEKESPASAHGAGKKLERHGQHIRDVYKELHEKKKLS